MPVETIAIINPEDSRRKWMIASAAGVATLYAWRWVGGKAELNRQSLTPMLLGGVIGYSVFRYFE